MFNVRNTIWKLYRDKAKRVQVENIPRFIHLPRSFLGSVSTAMCYDCSRNFVGWQRQQRIVRLSHGECRIGRKRRSTGTGQHRGASRERRTAARLLSSANATPKPCSTKAGQATGELTPSQSCQHCSWNEGQKVRNKNSVLFQSNILFTILVVWMYMQVLCNSHCYYR